MVERALEVRASAQTQLYGAALGELASVVDDAARQALVDAARGQLAAVSRADAVDALWRSLVGRQYRDLQIVEALEALADDPDEAVRAVADRALSDLSRRRDDALD